MTLINTADMNISGYLGAYYSLGALLTTVLSLILGVFVLLKGYKERLKIYWFFTAFSVSNWSFFEYLWSVSKDYHSALIFVRIASLFVILLNISFILFTEEFIKKPNRVISKIGSIVGSLIFIFGIIFPELFIPSLVPRTFFKMYEDIGIIYVFFTLFFILA